MTVLKRLAEAAKARDPGAVLNVLCPSGEPPTPEAMDEWSPRCPAEALERDTARLRKLARAIVARDPRAPAGLADAARFDTAPEWLPRMEDATPALAAWLPWRVAPEATPESIAAGFRNAFGEVPEADGENMADRAATLYRKELGDGWPKASVWLLMAHGWASLANIFLAARKHDDSLKMPGVHILKAWSERPREAAPYDITHRASLPDFDREDAHLIGGIPDAFERREPQLSLPGFEADTGPLSHWLLHWFAATGGPISQGGRLPLELSLMVGGMAHLAIRDRDGRWRTLRLPHRIEHEERFIDPKTGKPVASIERWLWPDGWGNRHRYAHLIPDALHRLRRGWAGWLSVPGLGSVAVLTPSVVPDSRDAPLVELTVRIPKVAAHGSRFDWPRFQRYAVESATLARGYLAAVEHMGRSARDGHPITRQIAAPILDANGEPIRRKGGKIVRSKTELVPNPQARFVRALTDTQLARMIGYPEAKARGRWERHRAREVFERLDADGVIEFAPDGKRFRLFGPGG